MKKWNKIISLFLVGVLTFMEVSPLAFALENNFKDTLEIAQTIDSEFEGKGTIEVELHYVLPIRNTENATTELTLTNSDGEKVSLNLNDANADLIPISTNLGEKEIKYTASKRDKDGNLITGYSENANIVYYAVNFSDLSKGTYELSLSNHNFVTYKENITIDNYSKRITLTDEKGLFTIGDVSSDGVVDASDVEVMLNAIKTNDLDKDLNLDGVTDIADLNYLTYVINEDEKEVEIKDTNYILDSSNVAFTSSSQVASGDLSAIFTDDTGVTLKPQNEGEISKDNPIEIAMSLGKGDEAVKMNEIRIAAGENAPTEVEAIVEDAEGHTETVKGIVTHYEEEVLFFTDKPAEGEIVIDLGKQVAVKKVTIVITETSTKNLADIAKVEFLNNVKVQTEEPENFYTPKNIEVDASVSEQLTVTFNSVPNVTGYEIRINGPQKNNVIFETTFTNFTIEDLKNYKTYTIEVQSVNGEWESGWSEIVTATPKANRVPPAPDMVVATPTYGGIDFSWKDMDDTTSYNLYYREVGDTEYTSIKHLTGTKYSLRDLKSQANYEAYLTGNNELGEGGKSKLVSTTTLKFTAVIYPRYNLINDYNGTLNRTNHIKEVIYTTGENYLTSDDNKLTSSDKWSMVDDNYLSYWKKVAWQTNAHYADINDPIFVLDKTYEMDEIVFTAPISYTGFYKGGNYTNSNDAKLIYWNTEDAKTSSNKTEVRVMITSKKDENNQTYYVMKLQDPIKANAVQLGLTTTNGKGGNAESVEIAEVKFYKYDSLVDDVAALFTDDLRVELAKGVDQEKIDELRRRADIKSNDEYNPYRESILNDLDYAEKILNDENVSNDIITLNNNISNYYDSLGFAMTINDYQPLGIAVREGEQLTIYVGSTGSVDAEVVFTQVHAEANAWSKSYKLVKGQNIITVPKIGSASSERGGSVYVRFTKKPTSTIKVRVSGGVKIPVLDTTLLTSETEKKEAIKKYINELSLYVENLPSLYNALYNGLEKQYTYDKYESAFGVTEIATKYGLLSFSAEAVLDAINYNLSDIDAKVNRVYESTEALDEMLLMFYRHKGLELGSSDSKNKVPSGRINIRYMTMFDGAFMYAGGYHIGIEYGSIGGLLQGKKNTDSATGYFGWGISHEVGHQINQGNLAHAEVTNNIYALLAQTANDSDHSRLEISNIYDKIYDKVTSHTLGKPQNVFVTLGMYWQLHLAYDYNKDENGNYVKTFDDTNSIFARINKLSRSYDNKNKYSKDELLILFASIAAEKDLTNYFEIWGLTASDKLKEEIKNYELEGGKKLEEETKAIYYLNDAARRYRLSGKSGISETNILNATLTGLDNQNKQVTLNFNVTKDSDKILGYEIIRNGESIAFVDGKTTTFTDTIGAVNNRAFTYEVVAYDYLLNKTNTVKLDEVKIAQDGSVKKTNFSIESNFKEKDEVVDYEDAELDYSKLGVNKLIDDNYETGFNGVERVNTLNSSSNPAMTNDTTDAYVIISLNTKLSLSGIKYTALDNDTNTVKKYRISVSSDKVNWTVAREGTFEFDENNTVTVYFMQTGTDSESQLFTYDNVSYVKIESIGNKNGISGKEFDVITPPGDNVNIAKLTDGRDSVSVLKKDYCYLKNGCPKENLDEKGKVEGIIEAGSVIIQGTYRGNPGFNTVIISDLEDNRYNGYQIIFAELNSDNSVYEVADGTWLFVITPEEYAKMVGKSIRATLYRSNNGLTLEDSRITSTSLATKVLEEYGKLPEATINGN